ncbi:MAG: hypothetical protein ACON4U_00695 [Myxococcota bacterium]
MRFRSTIAVLMLACTGQNNTFSSKGDDNSTLDQGVGQLTWSPEILIITGVQAGFAQSGQITLSSTGDNTLRIDSITLSNAGSGVFYVEERSNLNLAPGQDTTVDVVANFDSSGFAKGEVRIRSNDGENRDLRIPVCAITADYTEPYNCTEDSSSMDTGTLDTGTVDTGTVDTGS